MTNDNETKNEKDKKTILGFKASFEQGLNKDGETVFLIVRFNEAMREYIKPYILEEKADIQINQGDGADRMTAYQNKKRYLVKGFIFRNLDNQKEHLFLCELLDKGKVKIDFFSRYKIEGFKSYLKTNIRRFVELISGLELKQDVVFNVE